MEKTEISAQILIDDKFNINSLSIAAQNAIDTPNVWHISGGKAFYYDSETRILTQSDPKYTWKN
jgi:hypothetical protein